MDPDNCLCAQRGTCEETWEKHWEGTEEGRCCGVSQMSVSLVMQVITIEKVLHICISVHLQSLSRV